MPDPIFDGIQNAIRNFENLIQVYQDTPAESFGGASGGSALSNAPTTSFPTVNTSISQPTAIEAVSGVTGYNADSIPVPGGTGLQNLPSFTASDHFSPSLWEADSSVPYITESAFEERLERIKGQQRSVKIAQENLVLNRECLKAEGLYLQGVGVLVDNQVERQRIATKGVKLEQEKVKTRIEEAKLGGLQIDLEGQNRQNAISAQTWEVSLELLGTSLQQKRLELGAKRADLQRRFPGSGQEAIAASAS